MLSNVLKKKLGEKKEVQASMFFIYLFLELL